MAIPRANHPQVCRKKAATGYLPTPAPVTRANHLRRFTGGPTLEALTLVSAGGFVMGQTIHVIKSPGGGWCVQLEGNEHALSSHATQQQAIAEGRRLARGGRSRLFIHAKNGDVRDRFTYGTAPRRYTI